MYATTILYIYLSPSRTGSNVSYITFLSHDVPDIQTIADRRRIGEQNLLQSEPRAHVIDTHYTIFDRDGRTVIAEPFRSIRADI